MSTTNSDALARLHRAREKKVKAPRKAIAKVSEKKKAEIAAEGNKPRQPLQRNTQFKKGDGRSEKMRGVMAAIKPLYRDFLEKKPECEIQSPECTYEATCVHHTAGRSVNKIMDVKTWKASCDACNSYVEVHDDWARKRGFKVGRHSKDNS
jgi:hypothetical protein